jgi:hypothetical protein
MTFRMWLQEKWYEHLDEIMTLGLPPPKYALQQYFNEYKYWLKREYRYQQGVKNGS